VDEDPDPDDVDTLAELSFRDLGESTEVVFTQAAVQDGGTPRASPKWWDRQSRHTRAIHVEATGRLDRRHGPGNSRRRSTPRC
jgi:hypothetical protein